VSWHFSQALVEAYSQANCLDGALFAPLRSTTTHEAYCWRDSETESLDLFQFGMTSQPSTQDLGAELLTWYRAGFRASISAWPAPCGDAAASTETKAGFGMSICESLTNASPDSFGGKTRPPSRIKDSAASFERWPSAGMFQDGQLLELQTLDCDTQESDSGLLLPTPTARDWKDTPGMTDVRKDGKTRNDRLPMLLFSIVRSAGIAWKTMTPSDSRTVSVRGLTVTIKGPKYSPELLDHGVANRVDRLVAIGNGQVPAVAARAWKMLTA
jgi:hypothetical protein